jgi:hypothetical protein
MLVRNIDDVKTHINTNESFAFDQIKPYTEAIQRNLINPLFSEAFIDALDAKYNDVSPVLTDNELKLITLLQKAIIFIAYGENLSAFMVSATNQGLHVIKTDTKLPLFRELRIEYSDIITELGYSAIEDAAKILFKNAEAEEFDLFQNSEEFEHMYRRFIYDAVTFNKYYPIAYSRRTFEAIKTAMDEVEQFIIRPLLGDDYYDNLLEKIVDDDLIADDRLLLPLIRKAVANLTVAVAAQKFRAKATSKGWVIISQESTGTEYSQNKMPVSNAEIMSVSQPAQLAGNGYINALKDYLFNNADKFPLYKASSAYTDQLAESNPLNTTENKGVII